MKKIAVVGTAAAVASSSVLAAYPGMLVDNGTFEGEIVVGASAAASDTTAALSLIDALESEFSGNSNKVEIVAKMTATGGDSVSAVDNKETLNFGETLASVAEELDKDISDLLEDASLDDDDYTQELFLLNGDFEYRIFDEVDGEDTAKSGLYYDANTAYAMYTLDFEDQPDISTTAKKDALVGENMEIMGNDFTVVEIDEETLTLIGGSNSIAVGEGDETSVTIDGKSYTVKVLSVDSGEVYISVNGKAKVLDEYEVDDIGGISVAVVEAINRDDNEGYAQLVIGGQKVELTSSKVKINDEDLDDVYEDYEVEVNFLGTNSDNVFAGIEITYKVDENTVLAVGDALPDVLFDSFSITYDGTNDVDYSELKISTSKDEVTFDGTLFDGTDLPSEFKLTTDDGTNDAIYLGSDSDRIYFDGSDLGGITALVQAGSLDAIAYNADNVTVEFNISAATTDVKDNMFFSYKDDDEFYLYEITSIDKDDLEIDFSDILADKDTNAVDIDDVQSSLELPTGVATNTSGVLEIDTSALGTPELYFENELVMNFASVESAALTSASVDVNLTFDYNADIDMDNVGNESDSFIIRIQRASDEDDALELSIQTNDFVSNDEVDENSDFDVYVDHYGTMVTIDTEDKDDVTIAVPNKEVEAMVSVNFGSAAASETQSWTVDASDVESTKADLIADGYTILSENAVSSEEVEFDVTGVTLDVDASGENMIVIGGPAVNSAARDLLGITSYDISQAGVNPGEGIARVFDDENSVLIYGYSAADTVAIVERVNAGTANFQ